METSTLILIGLFVICLGVWSIQSEIRRLIWVISETKSVVPNNSSELQNIKYELTSINKTLSLLRDKYLEEGRWEPGEKFSVKLMDVHSEKINLIKIIRDHTKIGLKEAKDLADQPPCIIYTGGKNEATRLMEDLKSMGAVVEMVEVI